jgi:O-antigen/teichoic acid export membrane protein
VSTLRQYVRNIAALIGQSTTQRLLGMLTTVVLARILGVAGFGAYSVVINTASSAYGMVRLGVDASIHVHTAETEQGESSRKDKGDMLGAGLLLLAGSGVLGAAACLLLSDWLAKTVYGQPELSHWMAFAAGLVLLQCVSQFCFAALAGMHQFVTYSWVMVMSAILSALAVSIGAYSLGISGALAGMLGAQAVTVFLLAQSARGALHANEIILRFSAVKQWVYRHLRLGFPFYAAGLLSVPVTLYLQGMLSRHAGLEALGELRVITAILALISFIPTAASSAMVSLLTRSSTSDYSSFIQQSLLHIKYIWVFAVFSGLGVFLLMPLIVKLLFGEAYMGAVAPASYAILSAIIACVLGFAGNIIFARRRVGLILAQTICQFAVFAGVASILISKMGLRGYLAAELSGYVAAIIFIYFTAISWKKRHGVSIPWLCPGLLLSVIDGIGLLLLSLPTMEEYREMGMVLLIIATALIIYRFVFDDQDSDLLIKLIRRLLNIKIDTAS